MNDEPMRPLPDDDLADLIALAKTLTVVDTHLETPPDDLWAGIEARVAKGDPTTHAPAAERAARRWSGRLPVVLGAAAAIVVAVVGLLAFVGRDDRVTDIDAIALRNDGLDASGATSTGRATLVRTSDGSYALDVTLGDLPDVSDGFLELWIIDTQVQGMFSLGPVHGSGRYALPAHVDPAGFPIVDVSIEPSDGKPAHSGVSILRGQLTI